MPGKWDFDEDGNLIDLTTGEKYSPVGPPRDFDGVEDDIPAVWAEDEDGAPAEWAEVVYKPTSPTPPKSV